MLGGVVRSLGALISSSVVVSEEAGVPDEEESKWKGRNV
jgi:hypothetical protein